MPKHVTIPVAVYRYATEEIRDGGKMGSGVLVGYADTSSRLLWLICGVDRRPLRYFIDVKPTTFRSAMRHLGSRLVLNLPLFGRT